MVQLVNNNMKKLKKDVYGFGKVAIGLGVGTAVVGGMGGSTAGLSTISGFMPIVGTAVMGKHVQRKLKKMGY
jgi:hypothetical protein